MNVCILGDPHLGRSFVHGVPLARMGEREKMVWNDFAASFRGPLPSWHVCMGDLFDKAVVPYDVILRAARSYEEAAHNNPATRFIILKGNHDWRRDLDQPSAFDLFAELVGHQSNIVTVHDWYAEDEFAFFAWHPTIRPEEMVARAGCGYSTAFGHWDTGAFGDYQIPTEALAGIRCNHAFTGHVHKKDSFTQDGVDVVQTGSMQPYAHGEESDEGLYVTRTLATLGDEDYSRKCLRVVLGSGEVWDRDIDCLQLTVKREKDGDAMDLDVTLGDFDLAALFAEAFAGVDPAIARRVMDEYDNRRAGNIE